MDRHGEARGIFEVEESMGWTNRDRVIARDWSGRKWVESIRGSAQVPQLSLLLG